MRLGFALLFLLLSSWGGLTRIRDRNALTQQAATYYAQGNFGASATLYKQAVETYGGRQETLILNLAQACANAGRVAEARTYYGRLLTSPTRTIHTKAQQHLALLRAQQGEYAQAISLLRQALLTDPSSNTARYNYEALRSYLARHANSPQLPPPASTNQRTQARRPPDSPDRSPQAGTKAGNQLQGQVN
ncbi:MAG TPA: tetratricopeptide repeat protein, partial [Hymenobacter sp.]